MRETDLIHGLTFDLTFSAIAPDSLELADWVEEALLPVIEEVFDQYGGTQRRRVERLELDLGSVSAARWRHELPARLHAELSEALSTPGATVGAPPQVEQPDAQLLAFLRTGQMAWSATGAPGEAHTQLLQQVCDTGDARAVLGVALREPAVLTRLLRQFDVEGLLAAAGSLMQAWDDSERAVVLTWAADELEWLRVAGRNAESFWRWFLPQCAQPAEAVTLRSGWGAREGGTAEPGIALSELLAIGQAIEAGDILRLEPHLPSALSSAPGLLRRAPTGLWQAGMPALDDATLAGVVGTLQAECAGLIDALVEAMAPQQRTTLLRPALQEWLAHPVDSLKPESVLAWAQHVAPDLALTVHSQGAAYPDSARLTDEQVLLAAEALFAAWPPAQRKAVLAWSADEARRLRDDGLDTAPFWRWFVAHAVAADRIDAILRSGAVNEPMKPQGKLPPPGPAIYRQLQSALSAHRVSESGGGGDSQHGNSAGVRQTEVGLPNDGMPTVPTSALQNDYGATNVEAGNHARLAAGVLKPGPVAPDESHVPTKFADRSAGEALLAEVQAALAPWPESERESLGAWAASELRRLHASGASIEPFRRWLLSIPLSPTDAATVVERYERARLDAVQTDEGLDEPSAFSRDEAASIEQGLAQADFALLAPHWSRLLVEAPHWICIAHPQHWRGWMANFSEHAVLDILALVQPDFPPTVARMSEVLPQENLPPLIRMALPAWFGVAPGRLSTKVMLMHVMKHAPQHAKALSDHFDGQVVRGSRSAKVGNTAVDSKHFREPLRVLGPLFTRAEIMIISKCLNAGEFALLAPHWDRVLVLAPHWLRSEYPRLARTWLAGFDDDVLIDILSVVQAECCAVIEQLASAMPREQLHAVLRASLPRWFDMALDRLAPQDIMEAVLRAGAIDPAALPAPAGPDALDDALRKGKWDRLRDAWYPLVISRRNQLRRLWTQFSRDKRAELIEAMGKSLDLAKQVDVAVILQPAVATRLGELQRGLSGTPSRTAVMNCAVQLLLHAEVATVVPEQFMQDLTTQHPALKAMDSAIEEQGAALAHAHLSRDAMHSFVVQGDQLSQLDSSQLHRLLQTWTGFEDAGAFMSAIEDRALATRSPRTFFGRVLEQAVSGHAIDLDVIAQATATTAPVMRIALPDLASNSAGPPETAPVVIPTNVGMLRRVLPQRLADAMLNGNLGRLDALWPEIVAHHPDLLVQAAHHYLGRAEVRNRLIGVSDGGKMRDLLACLSADAETMIAPLLDEAATFTALLPASTTPAALRQCVLGHAFDQAMGHGQASDPGVWLDGLFGTLLQDHAAPLESTRKVLAQGWYELVRSAAPTRFKAALEIVLFGRQCLRVAMARLDGGTRTAVARPLPEPQQFMLTAALCRYAPGLTDCLLADGKLAGAQPDTFSAREWQALALAHLPRHDGTIQQAFWRAVREQLPNAEAIDDVSRPVEEDVQLAFATAFRGITAPPSVAAVPVVPELVEIDSFDTSAGETLAILLMRASIPDAAGKACIGVLLQRVLASSADASALHTALATPQAIARLTAIVPAPALARLLATLAPALACQIPEALRALSDTLRIPLSSVPAMLEAKLWRAIYEAIFVDPTPANAGALRRALASRLSISLPDSTAETASVALADPVEAMNALLQPLVAQQPEKGATSAFRSDDEAVPFMGDANLRNAGLVIVAPYIERLFGLLDITRNGAFISDETRQRGVHLLQYVITGQEATPEYLLVLNKLLCGVPAALPLEPGIAMTQNEKDTIEQMLKGVIAHWRAIGSSSIEGLRETFLQREGCLYYEAEAWHLKVPQGTFDMLLDRLPWGYKLIKFSWMAAPLNVTWR